MSEMLSTQEILEWYLGAGVDETCGDFVFENKTISAVKPDEAKIQKTANTRQASTQLAQVTLDACKNANDVCEKIQSIEELNIALEKFDGCALKLTASKTVLGQGNENAKVLIVGDAPSADEDRAGVAFSGKAGVLLGKMLGSINLDINDCYVCNILPWRPPGSRAALDSEVMVCLPFLKKQIELINPEYVLILGTAASNCLLKTTETVNKLRGKWLEYSINTARVAPALVSFNPSYLLHTPTQKSKAWADLIRLSKKINKVVE